jgi:PAS domain S-box-containing protein
MAKIHKKEKIKSANNLSPSKIKLKSAEEGGEFAENIINAIREPLLLLDKDLRVVKASRSFYDFFKVTPNETIGTLIYDLGNGQWNIPKLRELLETILPEKAIFDNYEVEHDFSTIGKRIMLLNARQIERAPGKEEIILLAMEDITRHKLAQEEVRESEERFRMVFENVFDGISIYSEDPDPSKRRLIECNERYSDLAGRSRDELLKLGSTLGLQKTFEKNANAIRLEAIERGIAYQGSFSWIRPDGKENVIEYVGMPIIWRGKAYSIGIDRDITERKQAELIIQQQNNQLHELIAAKDKFFSIIAHDLKSPFLGFLGLTTIMAEEAGNYSAQELTQLGGHMHQTADNLFTLLKNLLEWAQMQNGSMIFNPKEFSLSDMIAKNVETMRERSQQKGITIINKVIGSVDAYLDEKMIYSVLLNLLSNAVKFTHRNGMVTINTKKIDHQMVEISISDTGVGIQKSIIEKLFKVGEKTGNKGTEGELTTGLGLLLCKEFVERHGGIIWVESEEGIGSTFYFTLPSHKL